MVPSLDAGLARLMGDVAVDPVSSRREIDHPLIRRLEEYAELSGSSRQALQDITAKPVRRIDRRRDLIRQGANPESVYLIHKGWACRYKLLDDGRRQIVDFLIPGDLCDLNIYILSRIDHSIGAITPLEVIAIDRHELEAITQSYPQITPALWWQELVSKSCNREWIVNVGARSAIERIAHLLCEIFTRAQAAGLGDARSCEFPPTQFDLACALGLTAVHVNRTLQQLRRDRLIELRAGQLAILDPERLADIAGISEPA